MGSGTALGRGILPFTRIQKIIHKIVDKLITCKIPDVEDKEEGYNVDTTSIDYKLNAKYGEKR